MVEINNTYLNLIDFIKLESWSVQSLLDNEVIYNNKYSLTSIGDFLKQSRRSIDILDSQYYKRVRIRIRNGGVEERDVEIGRNIGTKKQFVATAGQFVVSKIDARNGAFGLIPKELNGAIVTNDFPLFDVDTSIILPEYLVLVTTTDEFIKFAQSCSSGTTNRQRMDVDMFLSQKIPLPLISEQKRILNFYKEKTNKAKDFEKRAKIIEKEIEEYLFEKLGIEIDVKPDKVKGLQFYSFEKISEWGYDKIKCISLHRKSFFKNYFVSDFAKEIFRGKSPVYNDQSSSFILNQKCNRWNSLDISFAKNVDDKWFNSIEEVFFTRESDVLINSTGEGTIGRATYINKEYKGLIYDSHMLLLRIDNKKMNPELFVELLNSQFGQRQINNLKSAQATKQTELGVRNLQRIIMPIPDSLEFQKEIIDKIKLYRIAILDLESKAVNSTKFAQKEFEKEIFG